MKFTKKTDYALRVMQHLTRDFYQDDPEKGRFKPLAVSVIANESGLSLRFLQGIVAKLSHKGLLKTVPGPKGGISLSRSPEKISILDIVEAVEGSLNLMNCLPHPEHCMDSPQCSIMSVLHTAQAAMLNILRNTNLRLMVRAKSDPFRPLPPKHFLKPQFGCPVLK